MYKLLILFFIIQIFQGCRTLDEESKPAGHFENATDADLAETAGTQTLKPEFNSPHAVLITNDLLEEYKMGDLVSQILKSDVEKLYIIVPPHRQFEVNRYFKSLAQIFRVKFAEDIDQFTQKVVFLERKSERGRSVWARDFAPLTALDKNKNTVLMDFNYIGRRPSDDYVPQDFANHLELPRISMPLYLEGGNIMTNASGHCMTTEKIIADNAKVKMSEDKIYDRAQIVTLLKDQAGCTKVTIFPKMPYETTGHIDMWAKYLDDNTILVSQVLPETMQVIPQNGYEHANKVGEIKEYLDSRIADLKEMGFNIVTVPLPLPATGSGFLVRSFSNSLLLGTQALVPIYRKNEVSVMSSNPYPDEALTSKYDEIVKKAYEDHGFQYIPILADKIIQNAGSVHCATMELGTL